MIKPLIWVMGSMIIPATVAFAGPPPAPLNKNVKFEPYPGTDITQVTYLTSKQEFRLGHPPFQAARFQMAEFATVAEHYRKYVRPDIKSEIQLAPVQLRNSPDLMANKSFQEKWKGVQKSYKDLVSAFALTKIPPQAKAAFEAYRAAFNDELFLIETLSARVFTAQDIRSRELVRSDLSTRFASRDKEWFDRLNDGFEKEGNLAQFFGLFQEHFINPLFTNAQEELRKAMEAARVEYATATADDKEIERQEAP